MGLDGVELVMAFEEQFGISISDAEAESTVTPGLVVDLIFSRLQATDEKTCQSQRAFHLLRRALMPLANKRRSEIAPDTPLKDLIPRKETQRRWRELKEAVQARSWPTLVRPWWLTVSLCGATLLIFFGLIGELMRRFSPADGVLPSLVATSVTAGFIYLAIVNTRRFRACISSRHRRVRDLVPYAITSDEIKWTREQVSQLVRKIVLEQLGIPESKYREDARFVEDLGLNQ